MELETNTEVVIWGDRIRLRQLLRALVSNAVRYTDVGGEVSISSRLDGDWVAVTVQDTGVGIPAESLPHIFDRFYRADGEISKRIKGAGLGLSLVWHIVTAHGGKVECESREGEGSTFCIRLPV